MNTRAADLRFAAARSGPGALPWPRIAAAGLLVGGLDFAACSLYWAVLGVGPGRIARSLGEMLLGAGAHAPGATGIVAGLLVEAALGTGMVLGYLLAARALPRLLDRPWPCGMAFGALALAVFDWILLPLSAAEPRASGLDWQVALLLIYMVVLGVPTAHLARRIAAQGMRYR